MRVFISSAISGMEEYRAAAAAGIAALGHQVVRAEDFGASAESPQAACLRGVRESDVVALLIGPRYGLAQRSGFSATHEEYHEAVQTNRPVLVFVQQGIDREPAQQEFLAEVQSWEQGLFTSDFATVDDLRDVVTRALHEHELRAQAGPAGYQEILARATALVPQRLSMGEATLTVAVAGGPRQRVLQPAQLEDPKLFEALAQRAIFGDHRVFALDKSPTEHRLDRDALVLEQRGAAMHVDGRGSISITQSASDDQGRSSFGLPVLIEEHVADRLRGALAFILETLDAIDQMARLGHVAVVCGLLGAQVYGWRTLEEHRASPNSMSMSMPPERIVVAIPGLLSRSAFRSHRDERAEDLLVLLRQAVRQDGRFSSRSI